MTTAPVNLFNTLHQYPSWMRFFSDIGLGHGSGSSLPLPVLELAGISTIVAVVVSAISIWLHLRNYRKPLLQRYFRVLVRAHSPSALMLGFKEWSSASWSWSHCTPCRHLFRSSPWRQPSSLTLCATYMRCFYPSIHVVFCSWTPNRPL